MKMRMIKLRPEFLIKLLRGKTNSYASNLPDDTELLEIKYDLFSNQVLAIVRSNSFEDIPESYPIGEFNVTYTPEFSLVYSPSTKEPKPMISSGTQPLPVVSPKPETQPAREIRIQPGSDTSEVEREFTPEQRKLLSFAVKGESVIIKPLQFLKTEWDDVNDVVKSLGGRWVKDDFESYWAIPLQQS
jgi:hypothetical protein